jgi:hypothetical protein
VIFVACLRRGAERPDECERAPVAGSHVLRWPKTNEERTLTSTQLLIGGHWTAARSGETEEVRSPFDGSVVGEVPTAGSGGGRARSRGGRVRRGDLAAHPGSRADADPPAGLRSC